MGHLGRTRRGMRAGEQEWPQRRALGSRRIPYAAAPAGFGAKEKRKVTTGRVRLASAWRARRLWRLKALCRGAEKFVTAPILAGAWIVVSSGVEAAGTRYSSATRPDCRKWPRRLGAKSSQG